MPFRFIIKDNKYDNYKKIVSLFFLLAAFFFAYAGWYAAVALYRALLLTAAAIITGYAVYHWKYKQKKEKSFIAAYVIIIGTWLFLIPVWLFVLLFLLLLVIQLRIEKDNTITISGTGTTIDSFLKQDYPWSDFNNIILKDGLLTLDFKNNKILQVEPEWNRYVAPGSVEAATAGYPGGNEGYMQTEKEFNDFCRQYINR